MCLAETRAVTRLRMVSATVWADTTVRRQPMAIPPKTLVSWWMRCKGANA